MPENELKKTTVELSKKLNKQGLEFLIKMLIVLDALDAEKALDLCVEIYEERFGQLRLYY